MMKKYILTIVAIAAVIPSAASAFWGFGCYAYAPVRVVPVYHHHCCGHMHYAPMYRTHPCHYRSSVAGATIAGALAGAVIGACLSR